MDNFKEYLLSGRHYNDCIMFKLMYTSREVSFIRFDMQILIYNYIKKINK